MSQILTFPRSLRSSADDNMPHIGFSLTGAHKPKTTEIERVHLFMTSGFTVKDGASFSGLDLGMLNAAKVVTENKKLGDNAKKTNELFSKTDKTVMGLKAIEGLTGDAGGLSAKAAMEAGVAFNPQTALAFEGVELRSFEFAFKMVPESKEEAEDSRKIENWFRKYMYPEKDGAYALKYPPKFKIQFFKGEEENKFMPMIHDCFLNGVQESQNPDGNSFFIDGQPTAVELSLSFSEVKQLTRHDLYNDSIGSEDPSFDYSRPGSYNNASSAGKSG
jgi:hypothetical protein